MPLPALIVNGVSVFSEATINPIINGLATWSWDVNGGGRHLSNLGTLSLSGNGSITAAGGLVSLKSGGTDSLTYDGTQVSVKRNTFTVGDANAGLSRASDGGTVFVSFDAGDYISYSRASNEWSMAFATSPAMTLSGSANWYAQSLFRPQLGAALNDTRLYTRNYADVRSGTSELRTYVSRGVAGDGGDKVSWLVQNLVNGTVGASAIELGYNYVALYGGGGSIRVNNLYGLRLLTVANQGQYADLPSGQVYVNTNVSRRDENGGYALFMKP